MPYIPEILPDEVLYSYLARTHRLNGLSHARSTLEIFFGNPNVIPSVDLPAHLDAFVRRCGSRSPFPSPAVLAEAATLLPYHAQFLSPDQRQSASALLLGNHGMGLKTRLGLVAGGLGATSTLRSCPECNASAVNQFGGPYWHRSHLLPEVVVCHRHRTVLRSHFVFSQLPNRQELHLPTAANPDRELPVVSEADPRLRFARLSFEALSCSVAAIYQPTRAEVYLDAARQSGLIRGRRQVRWTDLVALLCESYNGFEGFPSKEKLLPRADKPPSWMRSAFGDRPRQLHPVYHLLLIGILFGSLRAFHEVCASHRETKAPISQKALNRPGPFVANERSVVGDASLSCAQAARELGLSVNTVVNRRRALGIAVAERPKKVTTRVRSRIVNLRKGGATAAQIAASLKVALVTVYRALAATPEAPALGNEVVASALRISHRQQWQNVRSARSATAARAIRPATYAWLYRNDRVWLKEQNRPEPRRLRSRSSVDWTSRDQTYATTARVTAGEWRAEQPTREISATRLMRATGKETSLRKNLYRLPLLARALADCSQLRGIAPSPRR